MLLREFIDIGKTCKICGNADLKGISARTIWSDNPINVEIKNNFFIFKVGEDECYELFKFSLDTHKAEKEVYNPDHLAMMFCNNFVFRINCLKCETYSLESSVITYHPMGSLVSNIYIDSEEIILRDDDGWYRLKNTIHTDKIILSFSGTKDGKIDIPFMTLKDFPIKNRSKMLKKIKMLMLLS